MTPNLLEYIHNTVTNPGNEHGAYYEAAKCNCRCWFCPECCSIEGYKLRGRLIPVLETFDGLIMASLTIDPQLFPDPQTTYLYTAEKRCIGITTQDLDRWGHLNTRRYFYVVEWQKKTEQAHYHILYDSTFIPWDSLLKAWSKHRPKEAGRVKGNRPAFGTVIFSAPKFASPVHAARYATKYLIKVPEYGLPQQTGKIIAEDFPELMTLSVRRKNTRYIISIQSEDGIPWYQVEALLKIGHDLRVSKEDVSRRRL